MYVFLFHSMIMPVRWCNFLQCRARSGVLKPLDVRATHGDLKNFSIRACRMIWQRVILAARRVIFAQEFTFLLSKNLRQYNFMIWWFVRFFFFQINVRFGREMRQSVPGKTSEREEREKMQRLLNHSYCLRMNLLQQTVFYTHLRYDRK